MDSRRARIQEKRSARKGVLFLLLSLGLIILFFTLGIHTLIKVTNLANNFRNNNTSVLSTDKTPPSPPQFEHQNFSTNEENITIQSRAEAESEVKIYRGKDLFKEIKLGDRAQFEFNITLEKGKNDFWLTSTDAAGNTSEKSNTLSIVFDPDPPELEITNLVDQKEYYGNEKSIDVEGKTSPEAKVTVNERTAIVTSEGMFRARITLNEGKNEIKIVATDPAENKTEKILTVTFSP